MPSKFLWILLVLPFPLMAGWTGITAFVGQSESDWLQASTLSQVNIDFYGLGIEEKTQGDLRVGARAGQFDLRLFDLFDASAEKYNGQFVSLYLRWPINLMKRVNFHTQVNYQLNLGENTIGLENAEINWSKVSVNAALSLRLGLLSVRPFINIHSIDGDISSATQTRIFKQNDNSSYGLMLDYFVERSAFVRLMVANGSNQAMLLSFVREN
ncbi:MAG: hypothetical protein HOM14_08085 [Gammaproteobacteria bacterium]|nr:hypothetical protein [Gammaproteobacteria bacterium]MBT3723580.1 hypothetical protein [Gammaproteobacteria bacterium]MBT4078107.1 hypothetical protein [Gammaproteobacteria bacterium]MBT4192844.1 hypothetical protein [Gammaproteobacteria bacterium]MBT4452295.1 hypothetical protein [Gammaproteobacteria bacterium]